EFANAMIQQNQIMGELHVRGLEAVRRPALSMMAIKVFDRFIPAAIHAKDQMPWRVSYPHPVYPRLRSLSATGHMSGQDRDRAAPVAMATAPAVSPGRGLTIPCDVAARNPSGHLDIGHCGGGRTESGPAAPIALGRRSTARPRIGRAGLGTRSRPGD